MISMLFGIKRNVYLCKKYPLPELSLPNYMDLTIYTAHDYSHYEIRIECAISKGLVLVSFVTNRISLEEVCTASFKVFNCLMNLVTSRMDNDNELQVKVIASLSDWCLALTSIPL